MRNETGQWLTPFVNDLTYSFHSDVCYSDNEWSMQRDVQDEVVLF